MKSKFIFLLVMFSLFLNISHDILMASESSCACTSTLTQIEESANECCNGVCELHEIFHFSGILASFDNINVSQVLLTKLFFISSIPPTSIYQTTFKPPIA